MTCHVLSGVWTQNLYSGVGHVAVAPVNEIVAPVPCGEGTSEVSVGLAHAAADQKIVQSKRAVEIETLKAQAEVEPIKLLAAELVELKRSSPDVLEAYVRNVRLKLFEKTSEVYLEVRP